MTQGDNMSRSNQTAHLMKLKLKHVNVSSVSSQDGRNKCVNIESQEGKARSAAINASTLQDNNYD